MSQPDCSEEKATLKTKSVGKIPQHLSSQTIALEKLSVDRFGKTKCGL